MALENSLLGLLFEELAKLTEAEVANFCGEVYFHQSKTHFLHGQTPKLWQISPATNHDNVQVITFKAKESDLAEVALLRSQWEIFSSADRLTYRFFRKEFTAALFAKSSDSSAGRQLLADVFTLLWLVTRSPAEQGEWGPLNKVIKELKESFDPLMKTHQVPSSGGNQIDALLVCIPAQEPVNWTDKIVAPSASAPALYQGQLFKVLNPSALKAKAAANEAASLGAQIEKFGLVELQILYKNGRIVPLKDNEELIPYLENYRSEKADRRMLDKICKIKDDDSLLLRSFERNKFNLIDKFFVEAKPVLLVLGYNSNQDRPATDCRDFAVCAFGGIYQKPELQIQLAGGVGGLIAQLLPPESFSGHFLTNQIAFDPGSKKLTFHDLHQTARAFSRFMGENDSGKKTEANAVSRQQPVTLRGHRRIHGFLRRLHQEMGKDLHISSLKEVPSTHPAQLELLVDRESFRVIQRITVDGETLTFANLASEWKPLFGALSEGLIATEAGASAAMAYSVRRSQRQHETRFLKHAGILTTLLFSTLEWKLKGSTLGQSQALFYEDLWKKVTLLIQPRNEGPKPEGIDELLSSRVKKIATDFVEGLIDILDEDYESVLVLDGRLLYIRGLVLQQAKILYFWMQQIAQLSKGDLFIKTISKYLPNHLFREEGLLSELSFNEFFVFTQDGTVPSREEILAYPTRNADSLYQIPMSAWARLGQAFPEIEVRLDGRPMEPLKPEQFQVQFQLSNPTENGEQDGRIDWFSLNPKYFLNGREINEVDAKKLTFDGVLEYQGRFYVLDSNSFPSQKALEIFWTRLQFHQHKTTRTQQKQDSETGVQRHHILELLALRRMGIAFEGPREWQEICTYYDRLSQPRGQLDLGSKLNNTLKPYQLAGVQWLWDLYQLRIGGILADDMGLGKTAQALSFLQFGYQKKEISKVLVIVPVSLTFNWVAESEKFTPDLNVSVFEPKNPETLKANVIICTYSLMSLHHKVFEKEKFDVIIFDEAQYLKNISTNRFKSSENIKARFKVALTGTPIENNLSELYALFQLVAPGLLGSCQDFQRHYVKPEELADENMQFLRAKLKPLILRRRKQDLSLELPDKTENQIFVEFSKKQKELYRNTALSWSQKVYESINQKGASQSKLYMLTALLRLRQVCSDPAAIPSVSYKEVPPKIAILIDMLEEITQEGHSAIVFTQFMSTFARLKDLLEKHEIKSYEMHGGTPRKDRETLLRDFNSETSEKGSVLLMTLKTGGVGLNLTKASYVFHLEPWWNPAVENQATDRVHRLGQKKNVTVYRLIMKESVEEKVELLKKRKAQLFNNLFGDDYFSLEAIDESSGSEKAGSTAITKEDFDMLIQ